VGLARGNPVGKLVGDSAGLLEGALVGDAVGLALGDPVSKLVGDSVGVQRGRSVLYKKGFLPVLGEINIILICC